MIKTRRGVFINLNDSDITVDYCDVTFKFSSYKKRDIFLNRVKESIQNLEKLQGKVYKITGENLKDYYIKELIYKIYINTYINMLYK